MKEKIEHKQTKQYEITIIGAGGIGSHLIGNLIPALHRGYLWEGKRILIRVYDSDTVSIQNTAHQRFSDEHVGLHKVNAIYSSLSPYLGENLTIEPCPRDVRKASDLGTPDLVVVAVDSHEARRAVHSRGGIWLDLRCRGDGYIAIDHRVGRNDVSDLTPRQSSASCQLEGAIASGNIQFGHILAAAHGAQWVLQSLREMEGHRNAMPPLPQIASISLGTLSRIGPVRPHIDDQVMEENNHTIPILHDIQGVFHDIDSGEFGSERVFETISHLALEGEWECLWGISNRMKREISALIDSEGRAFVDIGTSGEVRLSPPAGATIPFRNWIHTHPMEAYWSKTDRDTLSSCSGILEKAFVLGHDHFIRTVFSEENANPLGWGMLTHWSSEPKQYYHTKTRTSSWSDHSAL